MSLVDSSAPISESVSHLSNTANFGLSKHLTVPISIKVCYLHPSNTNSHSVASSSQKYKDAFVFQKLLNISINSDLFLRVQVFDENHNALSLPVQTPYKAFSNNKRIWDSSLKLPVNFNQVSYGSYLEFTLLEIVQTKECVFGMGRLSLFNHANSTLRKGSYKIAIGPEPGKVDYFDSESTTELERSIVRHENGEFPRSAWLDSLTLPVVDKLRSESTPAQTENVSANNVAPYYLYIELPNFSLPIVYLDITYSRPNVFFLTDYMDGAIPGTPGVTVVINSIEIDSPGGLDFAKVYDPDFETGTIQKFNHIELEQTLSATPRGSGVAGPSMAEMDPIERKFQTLATNINNTSLLDKEVKPSPHMRDELWKILKMPSSAVLSDHEKKLLWKFRFYFSKNTLADDLGAAAPLQTTKHFLTKFLKCFNWENEYELDHAFQEIFPLWTVDKIEIGDALELLSNNFDPYTLTAALRRRMVATVNSNAKDVNTNEEKKIEKIFKYSKQLRMFAVDRIRLASPDELLLYLLQLVQALKYESLLTSKETLLSEAPLAQFLIERSVENGHLGNFFYWYVKVENEDQLNRTGTQKPPDNSIYSVVLNTYIERLKNHCIATKKPEYKYLKRQIAFIKKLTSLVELLRSTFKKNEATAKKKQFLQEYLADSSNEMLKFPDPFPLPLDPSVMVCGCYPADSSVFKSSLAPLKIALKTVTNHKETPQVSQIFGTKKNKYGKYSLMFKIGDDLRQDQLVIQIITLMDQLLKNENLNLKLTPYKILATSPIAGLIQFVPNETLDEVLSNNYPELGPLSNINSNGILNYLRVHSRRKEEDEPEPGSVPDVNSTATSFLQQKSTVTSDLGVSPTIMDNYVKSCAGYCVITYILGVGDRHLDNLLLSPNGKFWHADFGYILGRDPKPFPPLMKLPIQVIDGMGGMNHENFNIFKSYCFITYTTLRKNSNLILNLFQLMLNANIPDIQIDPKRAVEKVQEKFALDMTEEEAILHFQNLIIDSVNAFLPVVIDTLHSLAQYWRA